VLTKDDIAVACHPQALELYTSVLQVEPRNAYAANGVGAVLVGDWQLILRAVVLAAA
jgi:hypothetical protein